MTQEAAGHKQALTIRKSYDIVFFFFFCFFLTNDLHKSFESPVSAVSHVSECADPVE